MSSENRFESLLHRIRSCQLCSSSFAHEPRPVIRGQPTARLLIIGQAPGTRVHNTGLSFNDPSGDRLRQWLNMDRSTFYDETEVAIMPIGLCFPGQNSKGGDLPPRSICAPTWHKKFLRFLPHIKLTLLVGLYAQRYYLTSIKNLPSTEIIRQWDNFLPEFFPLPHPSWRNNAWLNKNPWFLQQVIPALQYHVMKSLS